MRVVETLNAFKKSRDMPFMLSLMAHTWGHRAMTCETQMWDRRGVAAFSKSANNRVQQMKDSHLSTQHFTSADWGSWSFTNWRVAWLSVHACYNEPTKIRSAVRLTVFLLKRILLTLSEKDNVAIQSVLVPQLLWLHAIKNKARMD